MEFKGLQIEETSKTPQIELNQLTGEIILSGKSIPENAAKVYESVLNWTIEYVKNARTTTNLRLNLEYFNTPSAIWLSKILKALSQINDPDYVLIIHMYLPVNEYDEMRGFEDIIEAFLPITDIVHDAIPSVCIKLYGTNDKSEIIKNTLVFI